MWPKFFKDYPVDKPLKKQCIESGKGIIGCEMHELNGWGSTYHISPEEWRSHDTKRKPHVGHRDGISSLPKL